MNPETLGQNLGTEATQAFTPIFGNMSFAVAPSMTGEVSSTFGTIPYLSLENLVHQQQMTAQVSPSNIMSGQNQGQQNIQGSYTVQDTNGMTRMVMGYQQGGF